MEKCKYCQKTDCNCAQAEELAKGLGAKAKPDENIWSGGSSPKDMASPHNKPWKASQPGTGQGSKTDPVMKSEGACPTCGCNLVLLAKALPSMEGFQSLAAKPKAPTPAAAGAAKEIAGAKFSGGAKPGATGVKTVNSELKNFQSLKKSKVKLPGCK